MIYETRMRKKCVLCGGPARDIVKIFTKKGNYVKVKSNDIEIHNEIGICSYCGLVQTLNPMTEESLNKFYKKAAIGESPYRILYPFSEMSAYGHLHGALNFIRACMEEEMKKQGNFYTESILDLGSGGDWSLKYLNIAFKGSQVYTYDPGIESKVKGVLLNLDNRKFDLIICLNVLEHVYNPIEFLEGLKDHLNDKGRIIISIPDVYRINIDTSAWFSGAHLWHFSSDLVELVMLRAGYKLRHSTHALDYIGNKIFIDIQKSDVEYEGSYEFEDVHDLKEYLYHLNRAHESRDCIFELKRK